MHLKFVHKSTPLIIILNTIIKIFSEDSIVERMNVINSHIDVLRDVIGTTFSQNIAAQWIQQVNPLPPPPPLSYGFARIAGDSRICIPGGSVRAIRVTCNDSCVMDGRSVVIEPLENTSLSGDVLILTLTCPGVGKKVPPLRIIRIESLL